MENYSHQQIILLKKTFSTLVFLAITCSLFCQYKKIGPLLNTGSTYSIGANAHFIGEEKGSPVGFYIGAGDESTDRHLFSWFELEFIPPFKYSYQTTGTSFNTNAEEPVFVSGKSKPHLLFNYNIGYHFLNRSGNEPRIQPFAYAGINAVIIGRAKTPDYGEVYDVKKVVSTSGYNFGARAGLGLNIKLSNLFHLRTIAGYNWHYDSDKSPYPDVELFRMYTSHVYVSTGLLVRLIDE